MHETKLGQLIDGEAQRDAIHVAVAPVIAAERLVPGSHIGFVKDGDTEHVGVRSQNLIGVVDPFMVGFVNIGERFWMCLYPQSVTSLRHDWTHPAFAETAAQTSERWLRDFAARVGISYDRFMDAAAEHIRDGGRSWSGITLGYDTPDCVYAEREAMWLHYEIVTGTKVANKDETFIGCAC